MDTPFRPDFAATSVGSLPHTDPATACDLIRRRLPEIPAWPQLPRRDPRESIYAQYSPGFPGAALVDGRVVVDRTRDLAPELERLYERFLAGDAAALDADHAAGLARFRALDFPEARALKGQVMGPVSWGLTVADQDRRAILYDEVLADACAKHLRLHAAWQERILREIGARGHAPQPETIVFVDEPYLASYGSAYVAVERDLVVRLLEEVFAGLRGLKGIHCCGNTDWSLLLATSLDILNFDAYNFAETLALYPEAVRAFLGRGGIIAWGIVPVGSDEQVLAQTPEGLAGRLDDALHGLAAKGVPLDALLNAALVTPACGLGTLSEPAAERALALTAEVSRWIRGRYLTGH